MTTVSGIIRDTQGNALPGLAVTIRYTRPLVGFDGGAAVQNVRSFTTSGTGLLTMPDLVPGHYEFFVSVQVNASTSATLLQKGTITVLAEGAMSLEESLDQNIGPVDSSILQQAIAAKNAAETARDSALSAYQGRQYPTPAAFVADEAYVNGVDAPADGTVVTAGGVQYVRSAGATALTGRGLPGWLPFKSFANAHPAGNLRAWGAIPMEADASADSSDALEACIAANPNGQHIVNGDGGTYRVTRAIDATRGNITMRDMTIDGSARALVGTGTKTVLAFSGSEGVATALTADVTRGETVIPVATSADFTENMWCIIESDLIVAAQSGRVGQAVQIREVISATLVRLYAPLEYAFNAADDARLTPLHLIENVSLENFNIAGAEGLIATQQGVLFRLTKSPSLKNARSKHLDYTHFGFETCIGTSARNVKMRSAINPGTAYGLRFGRSCASAVLDDITGEDMRRVVDGGSTRGFNLDFTLSNITGRRVRSGVAGGHAMCDKWTFRDIRGWFDPAAVGNGDVIQFRGPRMYADGVFANGPAHYGVRHNCQANAIPAESIIRNVSIGNSGAGNTIARRGVEIGSDTSIDNIHFEYVLVDGVHVEGDCDHLVRVVGNNSFKHTFGKVHFANLSSDSPTKSHALHVLLTGSQQTVDELRVSSSDLRCDTGFWPVYIQGLSSGTPLINRAILEGVTSEGGTFGLRAIGVDDIKIDDTCDLRGTTATLSFLNVTRAFRHPARNVGVQVVAGPSIAVDVDSVVFSRSTDQTVTLPDAAMFPRRTLRLRKVGAGELISATANVVPLTETTTAGTAIITGSDPGWAVLQSNGTAWDVMAAG